MKKFKNSNNKVVFNFGGSNPSILSTTSSNSGSSNFSFPITSKNKNKMGFIFNSNLNNIESNNTESKSNTISNSNTNNSNNNSNNINSIINNPGFIFSGSSSCSEINFNNINNNINKNMFAFSSSSNISYNSSNNNNDLYKDSINKAKNLIINNNSIEEFENSINEINLDLEELNLDKNFDILTYAIENDSSNEFIEYLLQKVSYNTLNYSITENGIIKTPLISTLSKNNFKLADFFFKNGNLNINDESNTKILDILFQQNKLNNKNLRYILNRGFDIENINEDFIIELLKVPNNFVEIIFSHYIFNNNFILDILKNNYKEKRGLSRQELNEKIGNEYNKFTIKDKFYQIAIENKNYKNIETLFNYDKNSFDIQLYNILHYDILDIAVKSNNIKFVKQLLNFKFFTFKNVCSEKLFQEANRNNNIDILKLLIQASIDKSLDIKKSIVNDKKISSYIIEDDEYQPIYLNIPDINGNYPLFQAVYYNKPDILEYLLNCGANINIKNLNGNTLLSLAIHNNQYNIVKCLLIHHVNYKERDSSNNYQLINAIHKNSFDIVRLLVTYGIQNNIDMNIIDTNGNTPITLAYQRGYHRIFQFLIKCLDINKSDSNGNTVLYYSIMKEDIYTIKTLIDLGADINHKNKIGNSLLDI
eukprot:jgi/Orpsp1_1/1177853/evm.model.c7180000063115.2